jgi:hypothetical protein
MACDTNSEHRRSAYSTWNLLLPSAFNRVLPSINNIPAGHDICFVQDFPLRLTASSAANQTLSLDQTCWPGSYGSWKSTVTRRSTTARPSPPRRNQRSRWRVGDLLLPLDARSAPAHKPADEAVGAGPCLEVRVVHQLFDATGRGQPLNGVLHLHYRERAIRPGSMPLETGNLCTIFSRRWNESEHGGK